MNLAARILKMAGWRMIVSAPDFPKSIICVAPHTSNWDFVLCKLTYMALHRHAGFLMKSSWFFFPLGMIFRSMGGIPVYRKKKSGSLVHQLVDRFNNSDELTIAITPEGTRSRNPHWRTGFITIAHRAQIPILLGVLDYGNKTIQLSKVFYTTDDPDADLKAIKEYYRGAQGRYPEKFAIDE